MIMRSTTRFRFDTLWDFGLTSSVSGVYRGLGIQQPLKFSCKAEKFFHAGMMNRFWRRFSELVIPPT